MNELTRIDSGSAWSPRDPLGLYVHVPFCASTCDFCAFYQVRPDAEKIARYLDGIEREFTLVGPLGPVQTVFWGGGTPGLLSPAQLEQMGARVAGALSAARPVEWTVELAPASVTKARLDVLRAIGVTRISLGVQSLRPELLDAMGRQHTREQALRAYERVRAAGFASVNVDLMFALPGQDDETWLADLRAALDLQPDHLSTYCLTFEEDTALWVKLSKGQVKRSPDLEAHLYQRTWDTLRAAGYAQYEVSNFARSGHACRHNLNTWSMHSWLGVGPSAASQFRGWRGTNVADLAEWHRRLSETRTRATEDRLALTPAILFGDALIFGLRMNAGVDLAELRQRFLEPADAQRRFVCDQSSWLEVEALADRLAEDGLAERDGDRLRLTDRGRLLADSVGAEILGVLENQVLS